ncbi:hypothetical protein An15g03310 [Aspergillus niger]|uniref:Uncharacterized protein n=2 Tax=Aspergillus niger TaxID=5061 RepID=A2R5B1_ASPNC|nr:hypothetical protein An15g03310 [Aspergillus niger]CAK42406.1 hypothetical protein An15g03310 [Aspergillus niger]
MDKSLRQWLEYWQIDSQKQRATCEERLAATLIGSGLDWVREAFTSWRQYEGQFPGSQGGFPMRRKATMEAGQHHHHLTTCDPDR